MEGEWVDFRVIKGAVTIEAVINRYGLVLARTGQELRGKCPIHRGSDKKQFTANTSKNVFKCFFGQCGAHGNVLDFVAAMERCSVREAAMKLNDWFKLGKSRESPDLGKNEAVCHGIYQDVEGRSYEVIGTAMDTEAQNTRLVYRELFGDYRLCLGPPELVQMRNTAIPAMLSLLKTI